MISGLKKLFILILIVPVFSCKKEEKLSGAGKGGSATIQVVPVHHNNFKNIINCMVYIKYNSLELPSFYDDSISLVFLNDRPTAVFSDLKPGSYYIFGYGYDTSIRQNVKGGMPYTFTVSAALDLTLPVTETHL